MRWTTYKKALIHKIGTKKERTKHGISYEVFTNIPDLAKLTKEDTYSKVWIVDQPRTTDVKMIGMTENGIKVKFTGEIPKRTYFKDEVMLHPDEWEDDRPTKSKKK